MQTLKLTKKYETYPEYKDSGVEWLGMIPKDWKYKKLKSFFSLSNEKVAENPEITTILSVSGYRGVEIRKNTETFDGQMPSENVDAYRIVRKNQLVVNTMWLNFTGLGVSNYEGYVSPAYRAYNISKEMLPEYVNHLMRSTAYVQKYSSLLYGMRPNSLQVKPYDFEKIEILYPDIKEQKRISMYLDKKTTLIDQIIERKEALIVILREKRNATISKQIVENTGKDWKVKKIKHLVKSIESGIWGDNPLSNKDDIKCLRIADFDYDNFSYSTVETIRNNSNLQERKVLRKGDILMEKSGGGEKTPVGRAILFSSDERMVCANFIDKVRVDKEKILPEFLVLYLSVLYAGRVNTKYIKQNTGIQNMDIKEYFGENISYPDIKTQKNLTEFVNAKISAFNKAISDVEKTIETLKEFKTSLISNAVTGKIKV